MPRNATTLGSSDSRINILCARSRLSRSSKVFNGFSSILWTTKQDSSLSQRRTKGQLIKSQDFAASLEDTCTSSFSDTKSAHSHFRDGEQSIIIGNSTDQYGNLVLFAFQVLRETSNGERRTVDLAHKKTLENDLVESRVCSSSKESIELYKKSKIHVRTLWFRTVADLLVVLGGQINSL